MLCAVSLQSQQVAFPQAHGPGAVPDCPFMTGQHQLFDLQLSILEERYSNNSLLNALIKNCFYLEAWTRHCFSGLKKTLWITMYTFEQCHQFIWQTSDAFFYLLPSNTVCYSIHFSGLQTAMTSEQSLYIPIRHSSLSTSRGSQLSAIKTSWNPALTSCDTKRFASKQNPILKFPKTLEEFWRQRLQHASAVLQIPHDWFFPAASSSSSLHTAL